MKRRKISAVGQNRTVMRDCLWADFRERERMNRMSIRRFMAALGALLAAVLGAISVWFDISFNRVYFPTASTWDAIAQPSLAVCVVGSVYFAAVCRTGRWVPWRRQR